ncbi:MAG: prepilin-type cleavage/methylation domain-containing protein [Cyanobacteria bacterium QS_1_48_34]|nr:MAG: prepilin-type cleavage/methylation domain-containing protein [Cyanobacteria bacterium QS_1_48_34]
MNNSFQSQLLQHFANKKSNAGFTLIELLVVIIIIGVLSAVALPNLLGQVGKARESEAKTALGSLNRAQQAHFLQKGNFNTSKNFESQLGVNINDELYSFTNQTTTGSKGGYSDFEADAKDPNNNGTRDYAAGVKYKSGEFATVICVADSVGTNGTQEATLTDGETCDKGTPVN